MRTTASDQGSPGRLAPLVCVVLVLVAGWGVWKNDQANAERVRVIGRALVSCRVPPVSTPPRSFVD